MLTTAIKTESQAGWASDLIVLGSFNQACSVVKKEAHDKTLLRRNMAASGSDDVIIVCISFLRALEPPYL